MTYGEAILLSKHILRAYMQVKRGFGAASNFQIPTFDIWPKPWMRTLPLPRSFRGSSANFLQRMDVSFNMHFLYFLKGQLLIARIFENVRMRYPENGWYEENDYIAIASASFRKKKHKKPSAGFRDCSPVPFSKVLWHNPAYHYVENKWRCSDVLPNQAFFQDNTLVSHFITSFVAEICPL